MSDLDDLANALDSMLEGFKKDPASTNYQKGYHAAIVEVRRMVAEIQELYAA